jgi:hypothetical protein
MVGRRSFVVLVLLTLIAACMAVAPALSGEHPWDADSQNPNRGGPSGAIWSPLRDTIIVHNTIDSSGGVAAPAAPSVPGGFGWVGVTTTIIRLCFDLL